jgi:class 3 adenylate cyclase
MSLPEPLEQLQRDSGLDADLLAGISGLLRQPPAGSLVGQDIRRLQTGGRSVQHALLLAILAASDFRRHGRLLRALLDFLLPREEDLSDYDRGRLWHLQGFAAWRLDEAMVDAFGALERSLQLLAPLAEPEAHAYQGRVWTSFAQLMHHQGRSREARFGFEKALKHRGPGGDPVDRAFTLGNLARVCMDFGDYQAAIDYFQEDLDLSRDIAATPVYVEAQLLSEIAACQLSLGNLDAAQQQYALSEAHAGRHDNPVGLLFAWLGLGRVELARQPANLTAARRHLQRVLQLLQDSPLPDGLRTELTALAQELEGDIHHRAGEPRQAIAAYLPARAHFQAVTTSVPREIAQLLFKLAQSHLAAGDEMEGAMVLRTALKHIDATALDEQRAEIESLLRQRFPQLWMLHAAGRFIGQRQIDYFLEQTGQRGFLGSRQQMAVLFSDIRGFTGLAEALEAETLIRLLNDFLTRMTRSIERFDGMVDKFIGDAVMAVFPADDAATSCRNAAMAALMMQAELTYYNRELAASGQHLDIGIGLHFGALVSGLIGSPQKRSFTVIGDVVNSASRLEGMTKQLGAGILLSQGLATHVRSDDFLLRPLGGYRPKGRQEAIAVFELMGRQDPGLDCRRAISEIAQCQRLQEHLAANRAEKAVRQLQRLHRDCACPRRCKGYAQLIDLIRCQQEQHPDARLADGIILSQK